MYAQMSGLKRAPKFIIKLKLECLYRFFQEPRKISKRIRFGTRFWIKTVKEDYTRSMHNKIVLTN